MKGGETMGKCIRSDLTFNPSSIPLTHIVNQLHSKIIKESGVFGSK